MDQSRIFTLAKTFEPNSAFLLEFGINSDFYSSHTIRTKILTHFPQTTVPFGGLDLICLGGEDVQSARSLTQREGLRREDILAKRIPDPASLPGDTRVFIFEQPQDRRSYGIEFCATGEGYIAERYVFAIGLR